MKLNLKILAPLLQCTSINRCALFIKAKKYIYFILLHPLKNYLIFSLTSCPSLSLSLSHSTLILSQNSLNLSSSHLLSVTLLSPSIASPSQAANLLTVPSHRSAIASLSQAVDRLTVPSCRSPHRHSPLCRPSSPTHPFCRPNSPTLCLFVIGDC